jgi:murein DD-endopeptidase MepM/ murein hydrolase activator NlpD
MARRLALALVATLLLAAPAAGQSLSDLQERIAAARAKEARLSAEISDITSDIRALERRVGDVSQKLSILEADLALHQRRLDRLNALFALETERLNFLRRQYQRAVHELNLRLVQLYQTEDPTLIEVILESESFQGALDRIEYLEAIARQDKRIAAEVADAREEVRIARERTKKVRARVRAETQVIAVRTAQQQEVRDRLLASERGLSKQRHRQRAQLAETRETKEILIAEANALAAEDAGIRGQLAAAQGSGPDTVPSSQGLVWPTSGPVTSPFGYRWGRLHAGIDIGAPYGAAVYAAASGTVVLAAWTGGYGNYICIDHGGALATCYAHLSSYAVSAGAGVSQGQVIGYVGNTGHSFGAHLHFEVRINGAPVDPLGYL